jgi:cytochrome P450
MIVRLWKAWTASPLEWMAQLARDYGNIVFMRLGHRDLAMVNHPDHVQDILVTHKWNFTKRRVDEKEWRLFLGEGLLDSEGDYHMHERRLVEQAFRHERVTAYGSMMADYARRHGDSWTNGTTVDVHREMLRLTLAIAGKAFLDADVGSDEADQIGKAVDMAYEFNALLALPFASLLEKLPLPAVRHFRQAVDILNGVAYRKIEARRQAGAATGDLLSLLIKAPESEGAGGHVTDARVRDEALTVLVAGHETTANALTFTWMLLAQHPEAEARLHEELQRVLGGRLPTPDDIPQLPYTEGVFAESMRLYPPVWWQARQSVSEYVLGGYLLPAGTLVLWSLYNMQRDPRWYTDPERFDPARMSRDARTKLHRFVYFPFGGGTRQCIGESFAWMEGVLVLATMAQRWRLRLPEGHQVHLEPLITLRPKGGLPMMLEQRRPE